MFLLLRLLLRRKIRNKQDMSQTDPYPLWWGSCHTHCKTWEARPGEAAIRYTSIITQPGNIWRIILVSVPTYSLENLRWFKRRRREKTVTQNLGRVTKKNKMCCVCDCQNSKVKEMSYNISTNQIVLTRVFFSEIIILIFFLLQINGAEVLKV